MNKFSIYFFNIQRIQRHPYVRMWVCSRRRIFFIHGFTWPQIATLKSGPPLEINKKNLGYVMFLPDKLSKEYIIKSYKFQDMKLSRQMWRHLYMVCNNVNVKCSSRKWALVLIFKILLSFFKKIQNSQNCTNFFNENFRIFKQYYFLEKKNVVKKQLLHMLPLLDLTLFLTIAILYCHDKEKISFENIGIITAVVLI